MLKYSPDCRLVVVCLLALPAFAAADTVSTLEPDISATVSLEARYFTESPQFDGQLEGENISLSFEPEFVWEFDNNTVVFKPYLRLDQNDSERTHADIRELEWIHVRDDWELHAGISKVFWGVTEFQHLVDVINQSDTVDNLDGEDKLGQPMVYVSLARDWGYLDAFLLPGFRERTFAGSDGRFRSQLVVDTDNAQYESSREAQHVDFALRWSNTIGDWDVSTYYFRGTNRDPVFLLGGSSEETAVLIPWYEQMNQFGLTLQTLYGDALLKLEAIHRDSESDTYVAAQTGIEYSFYGVMDSVVDVGALVEYSWDERGKEGGAVFQNDLTIGSRIAFNDAPGTEVLLGFGTDLDHGSNNFLVEGSRRLGNNSRLALEGRLFDTDEPSDPTVALTRDDYIALTAEWFF